MKPKFRERTIETFFDTWTPDMTYVLGYFAADGTMYKNKNGSCYLAFTSTDKELITIIKGITHVANKVEVYQPKNGLKLSYTIQIGSRKVFNQLIKLGFTPSKSLHLCFPKVPDKLLGHFLRGYFDGDGCASFELILRKDRGNRIYKRLLIRFTCGNKKFLKDFQEKLVLLVNIGKGSLFFHAGAYNLAYCGVDVVKLYRFMYPSSNLPFLKRKYKILRKGLNKLGIEV